MGTTNNDPNLLSIPESFESERLLIRAPLWGDGPAVHRAVVGSIEELRPWMPWAKNIPTIEESESSIRQSRLEFLEQTDLRLLLFLKETGQLVGSSGLHRIDWHLRKFEIGYWVCTSFSKQGYITEAVDAITNYAIQQLQANRIEIRCDSRNKQSARVAERLAFALEGILRNDKYDEDGLLRDTMIFSKVRGVEF
ncbi:GNAT family N-acetyltransferase [Paenibacillus sp. GSMTC-2017]|uniref:GNAT family N-acetyltransferase n=1 Tax=Paenibacillus sp. GSMTC-2017 TaxID=2794350 RepID=UPI0018D62EBE|nr:GNAT family N-acetyltransferase [Paenibacillus sp. GSMTC-2017]MBH5320465.1 GNAT family N-acetyltransferase [Paenibacillus sp. GSMTC-2017]